jgi:hypothetical protein
MLSAPGAGRIDFMLQTAKPTMDGATFHVDESDVLSGQAADAAAQLPKIILGIKFTDGIEIVRSQAQTAAA